MAITDATEVNDSNPKPVLTRPEVDMTKRSDALVSTATADSQALVKDGVLPNTEIIDGLSLSQDAIAKDAELLHTAITARSGLTLNILGAPDIAAMERILDPTNKKDRDAIEDAYASLYGTEFRADLTAYVGGDAVNYRAIEAVLNREDGRTNFGGNLEVALETAKVDPEKGNRLLRAAVSTLNSDQISQMAFDVQKSYGIAPMDLTPANATEQQTKDFALGLELASTGRTPANEQEIAALNTYQKAFIDQVIAQAPGVSDANRQVLSIMTNGSDHRTTAQIVEMANIALAAKDLRMFADAVGGPAGSDAREQLSADTQFASSFKSTFIDNAQTTTAQLAAADLLSEGKVSLATIIKGDTNVLMGLWDNPENLDLAASNSTDTERKDFSLGKQISLSGRQPANEEETAALAYYDKINQAMLSVNMDPKQRARVEDEIQHGGKTLVSNLVALHNDGFAGFGAGQTSQALLSGIENMSQADYDLLHNDPTYLEDVMKGLYSIGTSEDLIPRLTKMLQDKASAPTFEDSQKIRRTVAEVYQDTLTGGATEENLASAIASMSPTDAAEYKNNPSYHQQVDEIAQGIYDPAAKFLADTVLAEVGQTGNSPVLTPLQQIAKGIMDEASPLQQLPLVEPFLKDPEMRARLTKPESELTDEDKTIKMLLGSALSSNIDRLLMEGCVPLGTKNGMGVPFYQLYPDMAALPEAERTDWASRNLKPGEQTILNYVVAQNGEERLEDKIRAMVLHGGSYQDLQAELEKLTTNEQKEALITAYQNKYNSNLSNDFMPLVDAAHKVQFQNYLAPNSDGNQTYFDHVGSVDGQIYNAADASPLVPQRAEDMERDLLTQYQALKAQLPQEIQNQLAQLISTAVAQNQAAPMQEIMKLGKVAVDIVAVASILATFGTDTPFAIGAGGAAEALGGGTELVAAGVDIAATTGTRGIIDGVFTELPQQLLLAAPKAPALLESAAAPAALESAAAAPAIIESAAAPAIIESAAAPAAELTSAIEQTGAIIARKPTAFVIDSAESAEVANVAPRAPFAVNLSEASVQEAANGDLIITKLAPTEASVEAEAVEPAIASTVESSPANVIVVDSKGVAIPQVTSTEALSTESTAVALPESTAVEALSTESKALTLPESTPVEALSTESRALALDTSTVAENESLAAPIAQDVAAVDAIASNSIVPTLAAAAATTIVANEVLDTKEVQQPVENTTDFTPPTVPNDTIIDLATVRKGEGPFMSAERILAAANDGKRPDITEVKELTAVLKKFFSSERNGNKGMDGLKVKYQFITPENFGDIIAEVSDPDVKAALMQFAAAA
ncbi:MAG: hypothetical protein JST89_17815 [Cyanobacteria bacterium SZAS-4]|nr:hypothetical protein [Cyanobacteria bacterium SZAS-4]